eukprot:TRINITY_DN3214_c0_g1_i17.p2 TRINITY_DN3214_c0_g1~~TRINITY_DN3214_c0_g1_i17.p2  ORF type:complete len:320 (+),score=25.09 TRINITY_DN3214_c0_g1_i17:405-1364(+)
MGGSAAAMPPPRTEAGSDKQPAASAILVGADLGAAAAAAMALMTAQTSTADQEDAASTSLTEHVVEGATAREETGTPRTSAHPAMKRVTTGMVSDHPRSSAAAGPAGTAAELAAARVAFSPSASGPASTDRSLPPPATGKGAAASPPPLVSPPPPASSATFPSRSLPRAPAKDAAASSPRRVLPLPAAGRPVAPSQSLSPTVATKDDAVPPAWRVSPLPAAGERASPTRFQPPTSKAQNCAASLRGFFPRLPPLAVPRSCFPSRRPPQKGALLFIPRRGRPPACRRWPCRASPRPAAGCGSVKCRSGGSEGVGQRGRRR